MRCRRMILDREEGITKEKKREDERKEREGWSGDNHQLHSEKIGMVSTKKGGEALESQGQEHRS